MFSVTTDVQIAELRPTGRTKLYWAGRDLVLAVTPDNNKQFRIYSTKRALGSWPTLTLELARGMAQEYNSKREHRLKERQKHARPLAQTGPTYRDLVDVPWNNQVGEQT